MSFVTHLECVVCGENVEPPAGVMTCSRCGDPFATLDVLYDMPAVAGALTRGVLAERAANHWRYAELLPIEPDPFVFRWPVGMTPIVDAPRLADWAGVARLRLKDEGRNPTASFKDRASSVGVARAMQCGAATVACASTGNAASSLAGYAAMAGLKAVIFVPQTAPEPKIAQLLIYGATVLRVRGGYAQAYDLCTQACERFGWYNRNCAINAYLVEGKKTAGLEIAEQCGGDAPEWVAVSVGDGCTIAGVWKGLRQMHELGLFNHLPRMLGVQAAGMAPVAAAFESGGLPEHVTGNTLADSINVDVPRNWRKAVAAVRESGGAYVCVSDDAILDAMRTTGRLAGVFAEPAAAAAVAGVREAVRRGVITSGADVLAVITGSGLKDTRSALRAAGEPTDIDPTLEAVEAAVTL
jgi:threonine synthase